MNPVISLKNTVIVFVIGLVCLAFSPAMRAVTPAPDGGYPGFNTAEGESALFSVTTGQGNTANGFEALLSNTMGSGNTATGSEALFSNKTGTSNTADGEGALLKNTTGSNNTAIGGGGINPTTHNFAGVLFNNTSGFRNTAVGYQAMSQNQTGNGNTADGFQALANNTGSFNVAVGYTAGAHLTTGHDNIDIASLGAAGESNTMRIGTVKQTATFISGIRGVTTTNANAVPVVIDSAGQLGTVSSSARFKDQIKPMDSVSEGIMSLTPVTFHYKSDKEDTPQFGLIAEEVAKVNPNLVVRDEKGQIYTVRYEAVNAMLLNEFLKEHRKVEEQGETVAQMKKQIETLTAGLQKVTARVEANQTASRVVSDN